MLKKIRLEHLREGMYVHTLCGPWLSHDFWRTAFMVDKPSVIEKLHASPVEEVWIDTDKGLDTDSDADALNDFTPYTTPALLSQELQRATAICEQARDAVVSMFTEARMGGVIDTETAGTLVSAVCSSIERNPDALISVARLKTADNYTYMHSVAVCGLMVGLARKMGMTHQQVQQAGMAGLLHDMGKARTHQGILNKPGKLTDDEFAHMKQHPVHGHAMLQGVIDDAAVLDACLHHHERLDGKGYPHGLKAAEITTLTRMTSICDVYDAVTSDRPYKKGWPPSIALQRMSQWCHTHLDARIFELFVQTIGLYPVGSLVRLQSGLLGVVCAPATHSMSAPKVAAFYHVAFDRMLRPAKLLDLEKLPNERIVSIEDPSAWPFTNLESLWQKAALLTR